MLMISREAVESVLTLKDKLSDPEKKEECLTELEKLVEMKQAHLWRADCGTCCGSICGLVSQIEAEKEVLEEALSALKRSDTGKTAALLEDYVTFLKKNYNFEPVAQ